MRSKVIQNYFVIVITIQVLFFFEHIIQADTNEVVYNSANMHFRAGEFTQAIEKYVVLIKSGIENPDLFYNAANAYFRIGNKGKAIQFYEKAARLLPRDTEIRSNLDLARQLLEDKIFIPQRNIFERILHKYYEFFSLRELVLITSIFFGLGFIFFFLMVLSNRRNTWLAYLSSGVLVLLIASIFFLTTFVKVKEYKFEEYGVILFQKLDVKSGPKDTFTTVFALHEGTKVMVRETRDEWYFISMPNGMNGWIPFKMDKQETLGLI